MKNSRPTICLRTIVLSAITLSGGLIFSCGSPPSAENKDTVAVTSAQPEDTLQAISDPLVSEIYTADPSAHVFNCARIAGDYQRISLSYNLSGSKFLITTINKL